MSKIIFFSIPAYGHTNPTIPVIRELVNNGHEVWYYSFFEFQKKIEAVGAKFISCDAYLPFITPDELEKKAGKDFAALIEMVVDTTLSMEEKVCSELTVFQPDCIVSDSICFWGKLFAKKLNIRYICSTTTFAFNQYTAKLMKPGFKETIRMIIGMPRINRKINALKGHGYVVNNFIDIIQNDNVTDTIVYTSKTFQPLVNTFSDRYAFVGPAIIEPNVSTAISKQRKKVYISLGTILNQNRDFYKNCIEAFRDETFNVVMAVGDKMDLAALGKIPNHFLVKNHVNQLEILSQADVFITHCGMNSVNESLYFGVPMVLFPQHSEEGVVANRVAELGAGIKLKGSYPHHLKEMVKLVLNDESFRKNANQLGESFKKAGGAKAAATFIENCISSISREKDPATY
ncbi:macrolide family glycosyltransferase [Acetobacterium woodii]|uniref:Putative glycosyl transferase n=1 Tax=Acetobacterium woodii (strain ATCC 29683 / DSM 1030 / JCM 2381 / KCTC 1655 / WB1) TaxID=931626 RepID=H6LII7_ACEWD|nr:macrolide family glycosyltransferase [Acetobacterium woodii]AFA48561.1 putative glycosyl transferase [Acetobacterium woodii DSM 1030]